MVNRARGPASPSGRIAAVDKRVANCRRSKGYASFAAVCEPRGLSVGRRALVAGLLATTALLVRPTSAWAQKGSTVTWLGGAALGSYALVALEHPD